MLRIGPDRCLGQGLPRDKDGGALVRKWLECWNLATWRFGLLDSIQQTAQIDLQLAIPANIDFKCLFNCFFNPLIRLPMQRD